METDNTYNEGMYADEKIAHEWIAWIESIVDDVRDKEIYPYLSTWIKKQKPRLILEIGSGQGACSEKIDLGETKYIGVEPSAYLRARAAILYPSRDFLPGKAEALPLESESIDAAFSVFVWFHIPDLALAARELARVLKPGGAFAIVTANPEMYGLWKSWHKNTRLEGKELRGDMNKLSGDIMFLHTMDELKQSLLDENLVIASILDCGYEDENKVGSGFSIIISGNKAVS